MPVDSTGLDQRPNRPVREVGMEEQVVHQLLGRGGRVELEIQLDQSLLVHGQTARPTPWKQAVGRP